MMVYDNERLMELLSDKLTRDVLEHLRQKSTASKKQLAEVMSREREMTYRRARIHLHHATLPKLEDHSMITMDEDTVKYSGGKEVGEALDTIARFE